MKVNQEPNQRRVVEQIVAQVFLAAVERSHAIAAGSSVESAVVDLPDIPVTPGFANRRLEFFGDAEFAQDCALVGERFRAANEVWVNTRNHKVNGLGDQIMALRSALNLTRHVPDKRFIVEVDEELATMSALLAPPNVSFDHLGLHSTHFTVELAYNDLRAYQPVHTGTLDMTPMIAHSLSRGEVPAETLQTLSRIDFERFYFLRSLGVFMQPNTMLGSIIDPEKIPVKSKRNMLILPSAAEARIRDRSRSRKSLSPKRWGEVFRIMAQHGGVGKIGILMDKYYEEYSIAVLEQAKMARLPASAVRTPTLDDLVHEIACSDKVVGMDTGPMHIAADVIKAAGQRGREIAFRQIFNRALFTSTSWNIAFNAGHDAKVLQYRLGQGAIRTPLSREVVNPDIDDIGAEQVAAFCIND